MGMISSFLWDRSMVVEVDYEKLTPCYLSYGVPQVSHLRCFFLRLSIICVLYSFLKVSFLF
jgi:hypothetical protein